MRALHCCAYARCMCALHTSDALIHGRPGVYAPGALSLPTSCPDHASILHYDWHACPQARFELLCPQETCIAPHLVVLLRPLLFYRSECEASTSCSQRGQSSERAGTGPTPLHSQSSSGSLQRLLCAVPGCRRDRPMMVRHLTNAKYNGCKYSTSLEHATAVIEPKTPAPGRITAQWLSVLAAASICPSCHAGANLTVTLAWSLCCSRGSLCVAEVCHPLLLPSCESCCKCSLLGPSVTFLGQW